MDLETLIEKLHAVDVDDIPLILNISLEELIEHLYPYIEEHREEIAAYFELEMGDDSLEEFEVNKWIEDYDA